MGRIIEYDGSLAFNYENSEHNTIRSYTITEGYSTNFVPSLTMDYLFDSGIVDRIDFLKVDVEGNEIELFEEFSDENLNKVSKLAIEYHQKSIYLGDDEHHFLARQQKIESLQDRLSIHFNRFCYLQAYDPEGGETEATFIYWK
jgi:hypothetical protein